MEGHCSTGQSQQWAVAPMVEEEGGGKEEEGDDDYDYYYDDHHYYCSLHAELT